VPFGPLELTIDALHRAVRSAGIPAEEVTSVLLVGGSSRIALVAELVGAALGRPVALDAHPKHLVALDAAMRAGAARGDGAETAVRSRPPRTVRPNPRTIDNEQLRRPTLVRPAEGRSPTGRRTRSREARRER
jgi:molecular chaperone DnaK